MANLTNRRVTAKVGLVTVVLLVAFAALVPAATNVGGSTVNTFSLSGKYHGTLKLTNPSRDCYIYEFPASSHLYDTIKLDPLTGVLSGLKTTSWFFLDTEPKQGTYVSAHTSSSSHGARIEAENPNVSISFSQTSGTIKFNGKTGSVNMKMVFNTGVENTVTETLIGNWSCPAVLH